LFANIYLLNPGSEITQDYGETFDALLALPGPTAGPQISMLIPHFHCKI